MAFITKVNLAKQAKINSGDTANFDGSISIGQNLILSGLTQFSGTSYNLVITDSGGTSYSYNAGNLTSLSTLTQQLQVNLGAPIGGMNDLQTFPSGTSFESLWRNLLIRAIHPTYIQPSATLTSNISISNIELGTIINPQLNIIFSAGNSGGEISRSLLKNSNPIASATPYTDSSVQITTANTIYIGSVTYSQGNCLNNNLGIQDCVGRIVSGITNTNNIVYIGYRNGFFGFNVNPTTSTIIRGLTPFINPQNGTTFTINIPIGTTSVIFSYPATLEDVSSVKYVELSNSEVKGNFTQTIVSVEANNAYFPINYKTYQYTPVEAFSQAVTYNVTI